MLKSRSALDGDGKAMLINRAEVIVKTAKRVSELTWTEGERTRLSKVDMSQVFLKDISILTSHLGAHAKTTLRNLGSATDRSNRPFMQVSIYHFFSTQI